MVLTTIALLGIALIALSCLIVSFMLRASTQQKEAELESRRMRMNELLTDRNDIIHALEKDLEAKDKEIERIEARYPKHMRALFNEQKNQLHNANSLIKLLEGANKDYEEELRELKALRFADKAVGDDQ